MVAESRLNLRPWCPQRAATLCGNHLEISVGALGRAREFHITETVREFFATAIERLRLETC